MNKVLLGLILKYVLCIVLWLLCLSVDSIFIVPVTWAQEACDETTDDTIITITCDKDATGEVKPTVNDETAIHVKIDDGVMVNNNIDGEVVINLSRTRTDNTIVNNGTITKDDYESNSGSLAIVGGLAKDMLTNNGTINGAVNLEGGADTLTNNGTITGNVSLGHGGDTLTNNFDGTIVGDIDLGDSGSEETDTFTNEGTVQGNVYGMGGTDRLTNNGTITGNLDGGTGEDIITNSGTIGVDDQEDDSKDVMSNLDGGDGDDTITNSGTVTGNLTGGAGNDTIMNSGTIKGNLNGGDEVIPLMSEEEERTGDTITNSGTITGNLEGGAGDDHITLDTGSSIGGTLDGGDDTDTLFLQGTGTIDDATIKGGITNIEELESQGNWDLNIDTAFENATVSSGTLTLGDATTLTVPTLTIEAPGTLAGTGTIKGNLTNNGMINPGGNSIGTLTIEGNYKQTSDATLMIDISPENGRSDLLKIIKADDEGGSATLSGRLAINPLGRIPRFNRYTVLTAEGGIDGTLQLLDTGAYFFNADYSDTQIDVEVNWNFATNAVTPNQIATGDYINQIIETATPSLQEDLVTLGLITNDDAYRAALDQVHPEFFDAFTGKTLLENYWFNETLGERRNQCWRNVKGEAPRVGSCGHRFAAWSQIDGSSISRDGQDEHISYDAYVINAAMGGLWAPANGRHSLQAAFGYSYDSLQITNRGTGSSNRATVGVQGRMYMGPFALVGLLSAGYKWNDSNRTINYSTGSRSVSQEATASFDTLIGSGHARLEYEAFNSMGIHAVTHAGIGTDYAQTDGFSESFADGLGLEMDNFNVTRYGVFGGASIKRGISFLSLKRWFSFFFRGTALPIVSPP